MRDICKPTLTTQLYDSGFLASPSNELNNYSPNISCAVNICTTSEAVLVELSRVNFPSEADSTCKDYIQVEHDVTMCNADLQSLVIPFLVQNCLHVEFVSNHDDRTGSGAKLRFHGNYN